jgi:tetratricopeptide (TPR) repeat protein
MKLNDKQFNYLAGALILLISVLVYSNTFKVPLQFDDIYHVQHKALIKDIDNFSKIKAWTSIGSRPLPMFTMALNFRWGESDVTGYHIFNLIFHIITGWIVYLLTLQILSIKGVKTREWLKANKQYFALLVALLFVAHPMQTQAVTYIIQRITALATLFYLLSVLMYIKARLSHVEHGMNINTIRFYIATGVSFVLAMLSKQTAVTIPLALILVEILFIRDKKGNMQKRFLYLFSGAVALAVILGLLVIGLPRETKEVTRGEYFVTSLKVMVKYIQMMILPVGQNIDHDIKASKSLFGLQELGSLTILLGLIFLGYFMYKRDRLVTFGIFWFFITLSVESSVIPIRDFMFEHRMYLASYGFILAAAAGLSYIPYSLPLGKFKVPATMALIGVLIIVAGIAAHARNKVWQSEMSLWSDAVEKSPEKARPWMWQGIVHSNDKEYKKAIKCFDKCVELMPKFSMAYYNRANVYKEIEDNKKAIDDYSKAIEYKKNYAMAYFNRGVVRAKIGQKKEAIEDYTKTIKLDRKNALAYYNRGNAYRILGMYKEALADYDIAIQLDPNYALAVFNRGLTNAGLNKHSEAIKDFEIAIRIDPKNHLFYNGMGVSFHAMKRFTEAVVAYNNSISYNPKFGQAYYNRAYTKYFGLNDKEGACLDWQAAAQNGYKQAEKMLQDYCGLSKKKR